MRIFLWCTFVSIFVLDGFAESSYSHVDSRGCPFDQKLISLMNFRNGVFIEAGAHNGLCQSNTKRLEEFYGWSGILVEPSENLFSILLMNRPSSECFQCVLGSFEQDGTYVLGDFDGQAMSSVNGIRLGRTPQQKVLVRSLQSILDEVGIEHVDFFSLDTEGYELHVLQGIDFDKTTFGYLLVEIYSSQFDEIVEFLVSKGYFLVENFSGYNLHDNPFWDGSHNDFLFSSMCAK